jgi:hypothetical protein
MIATMPSMRSVLLSLAGFKLPAGSCTTATLAGHPGQQHSASVPNARPHPMRHTTTPAPASGGGSPPSCSSASAAANAPGSLMLFQVVSIPAAGTLDVRDAELVDMAVDGGDTLVTVASPISRRAAPAAPPNSIAHPSRDAPGLQSSNRTHRAVGPLRAPRRLPAGRRSAAQRERAHIISLNR